MIELIEELGYFPIRIRVAVALSAATISLHIVNRRESSFSAGQEALDLAWEWVTGGEIAARQLYNLIYPLLLMMQENSDLPENAIASLEAVAYALYYSTWHARRMEIRTNDPRYDGPLPNDITEVSENTLTSCLNSADRAMASADHRELWTERFRARLQEIGHGDADEAGPPVSKDFFLTYPGT